MSIKDWVIISGSVWLLMLPASAVITVAIGQGDLSQLATAASIMGVGTAVFSFASVGRTAVMYHEWEAMQRAKRKPRVAEQEKDGRDIEISRSDFVKFLKAVAIGLLISALVVLVVWFFGFSGFWDEFFRPPRPPRP